MIDKDFFAKYQKQLVWLFNTRIGRWFFKLGTSSIPKGEKIKAVLPNAISWGKEGSYKSEFQTNNKFKISISQSVFWNLKFNDWCLFGI